ncbi:hypothetical protein D3C80_2174230 [compost metagenome]
MGNAGKYISSESGPKADRLPRIKAVFKRAERDKGCENAEESLVNEFIAVGTPFRNITIICIV